MIIHIYIVPISCNYQVSINIKCNEQRFARGLNHILAGVSFISLLTAFEVMTIPVASGIIVLFSLTSISTSEIWFGASLLTGTIAYYLDRNEKDNKCIINHGRYNYCKIDISLRDSRPYYVECSVIA